MPYFRKCAICKKSIEVDYNNYDRYYVYDGKSFWFHTQCFAIKKTTQKRAWTNEQCEAHIGQLVQLTEEKLSEYQKDEQEKLDRKNSRQIEKSMYRTVTDWIFLFYKMTYLPKYIYAKLIQIYDGTLTGMSEPIPAEDLLYMWKSQANFLERTYQSNLRKGKHMNEVQRVNYDLAILMSKYPNYKKWKMEQEVVNQQTKENLKNTEIEEPQTIKRSHQEKSRVDINALIDEI